MSASLSESPRSSGEWSPSGVVTLLTDFGLEDAYVGVMKGVILGADARLRPVDLSHGVQAQGVLQAAWFLAHSWRYFPVGTVHVAVVDPGVGSDRRILVASDGGHAFLAPDNGLLGPVLSEQADVRTLDVERFALPDRSATFHGRDVFAPAAAALAAGLDPTLAGVPAGAWKAERFPAARHEGGSGWRTEVLFADRFGNLVTPLGAARLEGDESAWEVVVGERSMPVVRTYADVAEGECLALVGSGGSLEVSVRNGDAAHALGAGPGTPVVLRRKS